MNLDKQYSLSLYYIFRSLIPKFTSPENCTIVLNYCFVQYKNKTSQNFNENVVFLFCVNVFFEERKQKGCIDVNISKWMTM